MELEDRRDGGGDSQAVAVRRTQAITPSASGSSADSDALNSILNLDDSYYSRQEDVPWPDFSDEFGNSVD